MQIIELPLTRVMQLAATALVCGCTVAVAMLPLTLPLRLGTAVLVALTGLLLALRFARLRPRAIMIDAEGAMACKLADGIVEPIERVRLGIVSPTLASASLRTTKRTWRPLFVPGASIDSNAHWRLRCALLTWRRAENQPLDPERPL